MQLPNIKQTIFMFFIDQHIINCPYWKICSNNINNLFFLKLISIENLIQQECTNEMQPSCSTLACHYWPKNWSSQDTTKPKAFPICLILNTPTTNSCSPTCLNCNKQNGSRPRVPSVRRVWFELRQNIDIRSYMLIIIQII